MPIYYYIVPYLLHTVHENGPEYAEMNSKICNVPDRKANSFSSNSQFIKQQIARRRPRQPPKYLVVKGTSMVQLITLISLLGLIVYRLQSRLLNVKNRPSLRMMYKTLVVKTVRTLGATLLLLG